MGRSRSSSYSSRRRRRPGSVGRIGAVGTRRFGPRSRSGSSRRSSSSSRREEYRPTPTTNVPTPSVPEIDLNEIESGIATPSLTEDDYASGLENIEEETINMDNTLKPIPPMEDEGSLDIEDNMVNPILPNGDLRNLLTEDEYEGELDLLSRMLKKR